MTLTLNPNRCPVTPCGGIRRSGQVMCRKHWFMVPPRLRQKVWASYRLDPRSPEHYGLIREAVQAVREKEKAT